MNKLSEPISMIEIDSMDHVLADDFGEAPKSTLKKRRLSINLPDRSIMGGGAQVKYYFPLEDGQPGLRLFSDKKSRRSERPNGPLRVLETLDVSYEATQLVAELLPQLFLPQESLSGVPKLTGVGVCSPNTWQTSYYEITDESTVGEKYQIIEQIWEDFSVAGAQKNIFTLVEHIPHTSDIDKWQPGTYGYLNQIVKSEPREYEKSLIAGLNLYLVGLQSGIWNFDLTDKEPFLCNGRGIKILDTGGFAIVKNTEAESRMIKFYENFQKRISAPIDDELQTIENNPFNLRREELMSQKHQIERMEIGIAESLSSITKPIRFQDIARLLKSCCFETYASNQPDTEMMRELKSCYAAITKGESYWDASDPEELFEMVIIRLRRHHAQRFLLMNPE